MASPEIQIAVSLLCNTLRGPDTDDYKNMARLMKDIQGPIGLTQILTIYESGNINWYVDASFAVNKDMRRHVGGFITMETVGAYVTSIKQKINTKISTED